MKPSGWPDCAVCKAPVADVEFWQDPARAVFVVKVRCHGAEETSELKVSDLATAKSIAFTTAFNARPLLGHSA